MSPAEIQAPVTGKIETMKHTPGLLHLRDGANEGEVNLCSPGKTLAVCDALPPETCEASTLLLIACWKACEGINPEAVPDLRNRLILAAADLERAEITLRGLGCSAQADAIKKRLPIIQATIALAKPITSKEG